ncbi:MAG: biopolymer transporter ExbD [Planctomycetia bacterium]|nr:biopolymer transporter ExbD [Planctomycetia bacterium]
MKLRRSTSKMLIEPPSVATGDIAFNLLVFFLVCASTQPDKGRKQDIPRSDPKQQTEQTQNIEVSLTRTTAEINGKKKTAMEFLPDLRTLLSSKTKQEDRVVVVKSSKDTPYDQWIFYTGLIGDAGGIVTLQLEEEQTVVAN